MSAFERQQHLCHSGGGETLEITWVFRDARGVAIALVSTKLVTLSLVHGLSEGKRPRITSGLHY
jgi:hypothetical protein